MLVLKPGKGQEMVADNKKDYDDSLDQLFNDSENLKSLTRIQHYVIFQQLKDT